jgi:hypothetical protein
MAATAWACVLEGVYGLEGAAVMPDAVVGFAERLEGDGSRGALARSVHAHRVPGTSWPGAGRAWAGQCRAWVSQVLVLAVSL